MTLEKVAAQTYVKDVGSRTAAGHVEPSWDGAKRLSLLAEAVAAALALVILLLAGRPGHGKRKSALFIRERE
jgi:hypothetical protein